MADFEVRRIVLPTDLSECSGAAFGPARRLAGWSGAEIVLLNVVDPARYYDASYIGVDPSGILGETRRGSLESLQRIASEAFAGLRVRCSVTEGSPEDEILECARREKADLIVMSTHGHAGPKHWVLGGVSEHLIRMSPCPVVTIRPPEGAGAQAGRKMAAEVEV